MREKFGGGETPFCLKDSGRNPFCPKDSGRVTEPLIFDSILQSQMGGALKIVRGSRLSIIFWYFDILWAKMSDNLLCCFMHTKLQVIVTQQNSHNCIPVFPIFTRTLYPISVVSYLKKNWVENCQLLKPDALTQRYGPSVDCPMWKLSEKRINAAAPKFTFRIVFLAFYSMKNDNTMN